MAHIRGWAGGPVGSRRWVVSSKWQKQSQSTGWAKAVVRCSLAPHTSLILMPFSGSTDPVVHLHGLTGLRKAMPSVKADLAIYTHVLGMPGQY